MMMETETLLNNEQFTTIWNKLMNDYQIVSASENRKQSKPTLVLSVIGDSISYVPKPWPTNAFQVALIETAKTEEETWIFHRGGDDDLSKVVREANQHYEAMEFGIQTTKTDKVRSITFISTTDHKIEKLSTDANDKYGNEEEDNALLDFEKFVSQQRIFYFGPDLDYETFIPTAIIVCEGDFQTICHISNALKLPLPVIIMKGSGKAADLVLDYLDNCSECALQKKSSMLFGGEFNGAKYTKMKEHLQNIEKNRELVGVFDLRRDDPLLLSSIVGEAVISSWSMRNIVQSKGKEVNKQPWIDSSRGKYPFNHNQLSERLKCRTMSYVFNPKFSTATSTPLYFYLGYQILKENEEFMKECGKVLLFEALKANRCEYAKVLMDQGVKIESEHLKELYKKRSKEEDILILLLLKKKPAPKTLNEIETSKSCKQVICLEVESARQKCRDFLRYGAYIREKDINQDDNIGDILLWAIIFNRKELAEICWLRGKDHLLTGLICSAVLKKLSKKARVIKEQALADALEEHSKIFEERCTSILDTMYEEKPAEAIWILDSNASVWGIISNPLEFANEKLMYDVVAHTCSKKYMKKKLYHNLATDFKYFFKLSTSNFGSFVSAPITRHIVHFLILLLVLIIYSEFVLSSISTEYYEKGPARFYEYFVYVWGIGDLLEEFFGCFEYSPLEGRSHLHMTSRVKMYLNNIWNVLDLLSYLILVLALLLRHLYQDEGQLYARNMSALSLLFLYLRFLEVFLINKTTGTTIIMMKEMLKDLGKFILIALFVILGVGIYYHANLWPDHQTNWSGGWSSWRIWLIIFYPYWQIYGEVDLETLTGSDQDNCTNNRTVWEADPYTKRCPEEDWTVPVIAGLYMMFVNLLLVNIVIANFSNTFEFIHINSEKLWHYHLYTVINEYSKRIPSPINLIWRPVTLIKFLIASRPCKTNVTDSSQHSSEGEKKDAKMELQRTFQKFAALRNYKEP